MRKKGRRKIATLQFSWSFGRDLNSLPAEHTERRRYSEGTGFESRLADRLS